MSKDRTKYCSDLAKLFKAIKADDSDLVLSLVLKERSLVNRLYDLTFDKKSCTPLAYAYKHNKKGICILLVSLDANVNVQTGYRANVPRGSHIDQIEDLGARAYAHDEEPLMLRALNKGQSDYIKIFASSPGFSLFPTHTKPMTGDDGILAQLTKISFPLEEISDDIAKALRNRAAEKKKQAKMLLSDANTFDRLADAFANVNKPKGEEAEKTSSDEPQTPKPKKFNR